MKIPDSIRIGGVDYAIEKDVPALNDGVDLLFGEIDFRNSVIRLSNLCSGHQLKCITFLHEVLHGIRNHAGLEVENEEAVVDMFARGLYQVLQDNGGALFDLIPADSAGEEVRRTQ